MKRAKEFALQFWFVDEDGGPYRDEAILQLIESRDKEHEFMRLCDIQSACEKLSIEHAAALASAKDDAHVLVCQAVTLLDNGETLKASQLLRQWLMDWDESRTALPVGE